MKSSSARDVPARAKVPKHTLALLDAARAGLGNKAALFEALGRFRVLCAEREGPRGVAEINHFISRHFREALEHPLDPGSRSEWYPLHRNAYG